MVERLTEAQRRALEFLARANQAASPSQIGLAMDDGTYKHGHGLTSQGAGRVGGGMAARLITLGYAVNASRERGGFPAYRITRAGLAALQEKQKGGADARRVLDRRLLKETGDA